MTTVPSLVAAGALALGAIVLIGPGPSWVARWSFLHRVPRPAVVLWQAGAVAALLCLFGLTWTVAHDVRDTVAPVRWWEGTLAAAAGLFSLVVVLRLAWALARVAAATGTRRRRHRDLVDLLADPSATGLASRTPGLRVLAETRPLAYCLPGLRRSRVVLSAGTLARLSDAELAAVLAHERAHLRARHDLVLDTFDAVHQAFPHAIRSELPAQQARLLVELLADDAAVREVGRLPLAAALVALSDATVPEAGLGLGRWSTQVRLERLTDDADPPAWWAVAVYVLAAGLLAAPLLALASAA